MNLPIEPTPDVRLDGRADGDGEPVPGEEIEDNNTLTAEVTFE